MGYLTDKMKSATKGASSISQKITGKLTPTVGYPAPAQKGPSMVAGIFTVANSGGQRLKGGKPKL